jgi:hypothetical protein
VTFGSFPEAAIYELCQTLVLVEGSEDAAYIYARLAIEGRLDGFRKYGCHIVPVGGKSMLIKPIAMAKHLEIPTFVVFDADTKETKQDRGKSTLFRTFLKRHQLKIALGTGSTILTG